MINTATTRPNNTILVIGSTGKTGSRVVQRLEDRGVPVRHGSRSAPFDWENPQTWAPALAGVDKVYLTYYPDLAVPGSVDAVREITERAKQAGGRRLVLLSAAARRRPSMPRTSSKPPAWSGPLFGPRSSRRTSARAPGSTT